MSDWTTFIVYVSPTIANQWLADHANPLNRAVTASSARVKAYARSMSRGEWIPSPMSPIGFAPSGMLLNGHHRLFAVRVAQITCPFVVFRDVPLETLRITDTEKVRTNAQIGRMFEEDTYFDSALKVAALVTHGQAMETFLSASDMAILRATYLGANHDSLAILRAIKVGGRRLRAGIIGGFLLALKHLEMRPVAVAMISELEKVAAHESVGRCGTRNLVKWIENHTGEHARLATESASAVVAALRQFKADEVNQFIHPKAENLRPFRVAP